MCIDIPSLNNKVRIGSMECSSGTLAALVLVLAFYFLTHSFMLADYPYLSMDEPWVSAATYHHISSGAFKNPSYYQADFESRNEPTTDIFYVNEYILYPVYYFFGTGVVQGRIFMALLGLGAMYFTFKLANLLFGARVAILSLGLLAIDSYFIYKSRMIRYEMFGTLLAVASVYYYLVAYKENRARWAIISGILCGFCIFNHPMGAWVAIAIFFLTIKHERSNCFKSKYLWTAGITALMAFLPYFINNNLSDIFHNFEILKHYNKDADGNATPIITLYLNKLNSLIAFYYPYKIISGLIASLVLMILSFARRLEYRLILLIIAAFFVWSFILPASHTLYYVYLSPFIALLVAAFFFLAEADFPEKLQKIRVIQSLKVLLIVLYVLNHLAYSAAAIYRDRNYNYMGLKDSLRDISSDHQRVIADYVLWFHLKDRDFLSLERFATDQGSLAKFKPQLIIISDNSLSWLPQEQKRHYLYKIKDYISINNGYLLRTIKSPYYGPLEVYLLRNNISKGNNYTNRE